MSSPVLTEEERKERRLETHRKANRSEKGRARRARYAASTKGKATLARYAASGKGRATKARYHATEKGKAVIRRKRRIAMPRHNAKHPDRAKARRAVSNSIRAGRLFRQPCEMCGSAKSEGHHEDYNKPLDVRWLCRAHHREWHAVNDLKKAA